MSSSTSKTVLVTGANKGLGYHVVRLLAKDHPNWIILLACRDAQKGRQAIKKLQENDAITNTKNIHVVELDVTSSASIKAAADKLKTSYDKIDYLIQNAGISGIGSESGLKMAETILETNVVGLIEIQETFKPLLKKDALTVVVSSEVGLWAMAVLPTKTQKILDDIPSLSRQKLDELRNDYLTTWTQPSANGGKSRYEWPEASKTYGAYGISKALLNAYIRLWLRDCPSDRIVMVTPGYCATDLNHFSGPRTAEQGAIAIIWPIQHESQIKIGAFYSPDGQLEPSFILAKPAGL